MRPNDDLARWGEPPTDETELTLAELLGEAMERDLDHQTIPRERARSLERSAGPLLQVCRWIDEMMNLVMDHSGVLENLPPMADPGEPGTLNLRLIISRWFEGGWQRLDSTHPRPCVVRDMRRVPDNPDRVNLRTGDRVRIEAVSNQPGYLTVFNVGPKGGMNLLYPHHSTEMGPVQAHESIVMSDVEMTPPAGRERLYAVWSRRAFTAQDLTGLLQRGITLRDMKRVQDALTPASEDDWHAILLELEHRA